MLKKLLPAIGIFLFVFNLQTAKAQSYNISNATTETAYNSGGLTAKFLVCTQDTLKYEIKTSPSSGSDIFTFKLPDGITFNSLLWDSNATSVTYIPSADTMPKFSISWSGNFAIRLLVNAPSCQAQRTSNYVTKLWGNNSTDTTYFKHDSLTILSPVLKVTDASFPTGMVQSVGNIAEFTYRIENPTVNGSKITGINFTPTPNSNIQYLGAYYITRVDSIQHRYYNGYSYNLLPHTNEYPMVSNAINAIDSNMLKAATDTAYLDGSHPVYIHLPFTTTNCAISSNGETKFTIGCGSSVCDSITLSSSVTTNDAVAPSLRGVVDTPFDNATFCEALHKDSSLIAFICTNFAATSPDTGYARADSMRIYLYCPANVGRISPYSIKINGYSVWNPAYDVQYSSHGFNMYLIDLTKHLAGIDGRPYGNNTLRDWDSSGHPDQLAEGQNFKITAYFVYDTLACPSFPYEGSGTNVYLPAFAVTYNNQCFTLPALPRIASTDSLGGYNPLSVYEYSYTARPCTDTVPTDVSSSNNPFSVILCPNFGQSFSPNGFDFYCPHGYYQLSVKMPAGYHLYNRSALWRDSTGILNAMHSKTYSYNPLYIATNECTHDADTLNPNIPADSLNPPLYTENFYDSTITVNFGNIMPPGCNYADFLPCVTVPIELNCTQVPLHSNRYNSFNYNLNYICDSNCASCGNTVLTKDSFITYNHCDVGCGAVVPYTNAGWSFLRTNLGWINQNILAHHYYSICDSGINFSPADTLIDTALANHFAEYPGDQIEAIVTGGYSGLLDSVYQNKYLQIAYIPFSSHYVYELDSAKQSTFVITGCTGVRGLNGLKLILPPYPASVTDRGGIGSPVEMNFSIDSAIKYTNIQKYDSLLKDPNLENLSIIADIHLRVLTGNSLNYYPSGRNIVNLRTEFMCVNRTDTAPAPSGDTNASCDAWGNIAYLYMVSPGFATNYDLTTTSNCTLFPFSCRLECSGALDSYHLDDFDYEFRPYAMLDSTVTFIIPSGYTYKYATFSAYMDNYISNSSQNYFRLGDSLVNFHITPFYHSNTLPDTVVFKGLNNSCWPLIDQKFNINGGQQYEITTYSQPACNAPSPSKFYFYSGCTVGTQQSDPFFQYHYVMPKPDSVIVTHLSPVVHLDIPPTVNDSSNTITFKFILCDSAYVSGVGDGWLAIQNIGSDSLLINSATLTNIHTHVSYTGIQYTDSTKGVLFNVDSLGLGKCDTLLLTATINPNSQSCPTPVGVGTGYLNVIYGNVCSGTITRPDSACEDRIDSFRYNVFPTTLELLVNGQSPDTVNLCGGQLIENLGMISANYGTISDPMFWMTLPTGVSFDSLTFQYPCPGGKDTTLYISDTTNITGLLGGNPIGWKLDKDLRMHGLRGARVPNTIDSVNQVCITVYLNMNCHYRNADSIKFFATGYTTCSILDSAKQSVQPKVDSLCFTVRITSNSPVCIGNSAHATATASGGDSPFTYLWSNGQTTQTATGLSAGSYSVVVKDSNGCRGVDSVKIRVDSIHVLVTPVNIRCNGGINGSASATVSGGISPFTYSWTPSGGTNAMATGLSAGTYTVTVTDNNGCSATVSTTITQPVLLTVTGSVAANVNCKGLSNGSASSTVSGGTLPYSYSWTPSGGTNATATGLSAGTYTVTVTDNYGCAATASVTITQPTLLNVVDSVIANVSCNGLSNGIDSATASGGTSPYTYAWSPTGGTNATVTGLSAGTYTITITDNNGCTVSTTTTITQPNILSVSTNVNSDVSCNGGTNGSITSTVGGGTSPYTYSWTPSGGSNGRATGLSVGTYTITVTDNNGCTATASAIITQPTLLTVTANVTANVTCNGLSNGSASSTVSGGISPYTYSWTSGGTNATAIGLSAGTYTVTVTDSNGCIATASVIITQPAILTAITTIIANVTCNGLSNGMDSVTVSGGTSPYTYLWSNNNSQTTITATGLSAGTYTITVTDNNGCQATTSSTITQPVVLSVSSSVIANVSCNGLSNGSASSTVSGGTAPFTYSWTPSGGTNATATGLSAGTYTLTVTDNDGCSATTSVIIAQPVLLKDTIANSSFTNCSGIFDGILTVTATGGTSPYTYSWNPSGQTTRTVTGLSVGSYTVTVTDANGCQATASITITATPVLTATTTVITNVSCNGGSNGSAYVTASGGISPYTYLWNPSSETTDTATGLSAGAYTVTVLDQMDGCTVTATVNISQPNPLVIDTFSSPAACADNGLAWIKVSGGTSSYEFSWTPSGETTDTATGLATGYYTVTVTDSNGCVATTTVTVGAISCCDAPPKTDFTDSITYLGSYTDTTLPFTNPGPAGTYTVTQVGINWTFNNFIGIYPLFINGTFYVNQNMTIENSDVYLGPSARIYVEGGDSLALINCHLHACSRMWDGIYLEVKPKFRGYLTSSIYVENSLIEDAENAIVSTTGEPCKVVIRGSAMNANFVGLEIENYAGTGNYPLTIDSTTFACDSSAWVPSSWVWSLSKATTSLLPPRLVGQPSCMGIVFDDVRGVVVGEPTYSTNIFENMYYGIYSVATNLNVYNNQFKYIGYPQINYSPFYGHLGTGIMAIGNKSGIYTATIGQSGTVLSNTFDSCVYGVCVRDTINAKIGNNKFINSQFGAGIVAENNFGNSIDIGFSYPYYTNFDSNVFIGIADYFNPHSNIQISWNQIKSTYVGILADEALYGPHNIYLISENTINSTSEGIVGYHFKGTIKSNRITMTPSCGSCFVEGIFLSPAQNSNVYNNTVTNKKGVGEGIRVQSPHSQNNQITCNYTNFGVNGVVFYGSQIVGTYMDYNIMSKYSYSGLYLNSTGDIGQQGNPINGTSNQWLTDPCAGPSHSTYNLKNPGQTTKFYVDINSTLCTTLFPYNNAGTYLIPFDTSGTDCYVCSGPSPCGTKTLTTTGTTGLTPGVAQQIVSGTDSVIAFPAATHWDQKQSLYNNLQTVDSSMVDSLAVIQQFNDSVAISNMGYLQNMNTALTDTLGVSSADLSTAIANSAAIASPDTTETTAQSVYNVVIQMMSAGQNFADSGKAAFLRTIAPLCPYQYGYGVYMARALLLPIDTTVYLSDCEQIDTAFHYSHSPHKKTTKTVTANVYPNPANTQLTIQIIYSSDTNENAQNGIEHFYLYDGLGNLVQANELRDNFTTIPLTQLSAGIYYYRILDEKMAVIKTDNLLIIR